MILIAGATGYLGGFITRGLLQQGHKVRVLVRPQSPYAELKDSGAEPVNGDLKNRDSLRPACAGVETVITTANSAQRGGNDTPETVDLRGNHNLIDAAREAGVSQYIFVSAYGADVSHPVPFLKAKARSEEYLRASGMNYTILAPHIFMDVWIPLIVGSALEEQRPVFLFGNGERKHSFIAVADVAAFAIAALGNEMAFNQKLALGGPEAVSWREICALTEKAAGRSIPIYALPLGETEPQLPELIIGFLKSMEVGDVIIPMTETAQAFGVAQTSLEQFVQSRFGGQAEKQS